MYNDDTRETYVERRKAENLAQAERSYEINGSHRNVWIFLFQWAMAEEEYGEHWDRVMGVTLTNIAHPKGKPAPTDLNPDSLEQVEIDMPRPWVGLTKEERHEISMANKPYVADIMAAHEAKLKEKNT